MSYYISNEFKDRKRIAEFFFFKLEFKVFNMGQRNFQMFTKQLRFRGKNDVCKCKGFLDCVRFMG